MIIPNFAFMQLRYCGFDDRFIVILWNLCVTYVHINK